MSENLDFKEMLQVLNAFRVKFLLAGGHAVMEYAEPRYTKDIDLWVEPSPENARKTWRALRAFGAPLENLTLEDLSNDQMVYQMGVPPSRIDIMMGVPGVTFSTAWKNRRASQYGEIPIFVMSRRDLMRAKRNAGRPQDLLDLTALKQAQDHPAPRQKRRRK